MMKAADSRRQRHKWIVRLGLSAMSLLLCCTGCAGSTASVQVAQSGDNAESSNTAAPGPQIGLVFDSFVIERWERDRDVFNTTATQLGASVLVGNANGDVQEQISIINHMIDIQVDVLVIIAVDGSKLTDCVNRAHRQGIAVIAYDRMILGSLTDLYISFDNETVGRYMAEVINASLPTGGRYLKINGPDIDYNVTLINQGFDQTIRSDLELIDQTACQDWNDEEAFVYLTEHPDDLSQSDAIMCGNDSLAGQAVRALAERQRAGAVVVTGQDADLEACQRIVESTQTMTVYKPIDELAARAAEYAVKLAEGRDLRVTDTLTAAGLTVPYVSIQPVKVTRDNLDRVIIDGGFHLREDVYLHQS
ncbi:sugar ABC transporter substrate-binding protein [Oscillospiraceae bacterium HV4-5-C5C]|nr:sugar ABC transporter substrate-binding protein [Oscillospiraceae bacterium HV4-5-C5C]